MRRPAIFDGLGTASVHTSPPTKKVLHIFVAIENWEPPNIPLVVCICAAPSASDEKIPVRHDKCAHYTLFIVTAAGLHESGCHTPKLHDGGQTEPDKLACLCCCRCSAAVTCCRERSGPAPVEASPLVQLAAAPSLPSGQPGYPSRWEQTVAMLMGTAVLVAACPIPAHAHPPQASLMARLIALWRR